MCVSNDEMASISHSETIKEMVSAGSKYLLETKRTKAQWNPTFLNYTNTFLKDIGAGTPGS